LILKEDYGEILWVFGSDTAEAHLTMKGEYIVLFFENGIGGPLFI